MIFNNLGAGSSLGAGSGIVSDERKASAVFLKPEVSASKISKSYPEKYDLFAHVCGAGTYI